MEDRKRSMPYDQGDGPAFKKQALAPNGANKPHPDADMPWKDDLERFTKDAVLRQMNEYKREKNTLKSELEDIRKKTRHHDEHLRAIDAWFKQLLDEIKTMIPGDDDESMELSDLPTSLLFENQPDLEQHISKRSKEVRTIVSRLFSQSKSFTPEVVELQKRIAELEAQEKSHLTELDSLRLENDNVEARLETATERYVIAEKKAERAKSAMVAKLEKQLIGSSKPSDDATVKKEEGVNGVSEHGQDYTKLEIEHNKVLATSQTLQEQVEKLQEETVRLQSQATEASAKSTNLTDEDYAKTELFKQFKAQHEDTIKKLNDLEARASQLKDENRMLLQERTSYQNKLDDETRATVSDKDNQLGQIEKDLVRIRAERDELQAKLSMEKAKAEERQSSVDKTRELCDAQEDRIKSLESENQRLQAEIMDVDDAQLEAMSVEELRSKYHSLNQNYKSLNMELTSMSSAYTKATKTAKQNVTKMAEQDEKVQRLNAEKAKADQKYFAAMRSKDAREQEIRTLKMQTAKSSDTVQQLKEAETASKALIATLEKQLVEVKEGHSTKTVECRTLQSDKDTQVLEVSRLKKQITELTQQLTNKDTELSNKAASVRAAELQAQQVQSELDTKQKQFDMGKGKAGETNMYESLRAMMYCQCKKNFKNTVLKNCGHVLCDACVNERISARSRKCPLCMKSFGSNDYMTIHLDRD